MKLYLSKVADQIRIFLFILQKVVKVNWNAVLINNLVSSIRTHEPVTYKSISM